MAYLSEEDYDSDSSSLEVLDITEQQRNLRELARVRGLQTFGSTANQYRKIHPEATEQEVLQHRSILQNDKVSLDNIDLINLETARAKEVFGEDEFDPRYNFFRNKLVDEVRNLWEDVSIDKQILKDTFLNKKDLYYNAAQQELKKTCEKILAREGTDLPKLDAPRVYAQFLSMQMFLEQSRFTQWLAEQTIFIFNSIPGKIEEITGIEFSQENLPEIAEFQARLDGTAELAKKIAYFSTVQDNLLNGILDETVPRKDIVAEIQKLERNFSIAKSKRSWKRERCKRKKRSIVEVTKRLRPFDFRFAEPKKPKGWYKEHQRLQKKTSQKQRKAKKEQKRQKSKQPQRSRSYLVSRSSSRPQGRSASRASSRGRSRSSKRSISRPRAPSPSSNRPRSNKVVVPNGQSVANLEDHNPNEN